MILIDLVLLHHKKNIIPMDDVTIPIRRLGDHRVELRRSIALRPFLSKGLPFSF
jgi:hypothetical protein